MPTWIGQIEVLVEEPTVAAFLERICDYARVISFDRRGAGLSDPWLGVPTLEEQMDDVLAVLDAAGSQRTTLLASLEGGRAGCPTTRSDGRGSTQAWRSGAPGPCRQRLRPARRTTRPSSNGPDGWSYSASPGTISKIMGAIGETDVRHVLPSIRVPTLIMHRRQDPFLMVEHGRYLAEHIPGSRYVELEGSATAAGRSSRPGTACWPPSTGPRGRSRRDHDR